jgi:hypothetical protein
MKVIPASYSFDLEGTWMKVIPASYYFDLEGT